MAAAAAPAPTQVGAPGQATPAPASAHASAPPSHQNPPPPPPPPPPRADAPARLQVPQAAAPSGDTPAASNAPRSFEDRMVKVSGLSAGGNKAKLPIILALLALIAGAAFFALSGLF